MNTWWVLCRCWCGERERERERVGAADRRPGGGGDGDKAGEREEEEDADEATSSLSSLLPLPLSTLCLLFDSLLDVAAGRTPTSEGEKLLADLGTLPSLSLLLKEGVKLVLYPPTEDGPAPDPLTASLSHSLSSLSLSPDSIDLSSLYLTPMTDVLSSLSTELNTIPLYIGVERRERESEGESEGEGEEEASGGSADELDPEREEERRRDSTPASALSYLSSTLLYPFSVLMPSPSPTGADICIIVGISVRETASEVKERLRADYLRIVRERERERDKE